MDFAVCLNQIASEKYRAMMFTSRKRKDRYNNLKKEILK